MKLMTRLLGRNYWVRKMVPESGIEEILPKRMNIDDYYSYSKLCNNCTTITNLYIKKGVYVKDIIAHISCNNCECKLTKE